MPDQTPPLIFTADSIVDTVRQPMLILSADLVVRRANRSFNRTFAVTPERPSTGSFTTWEPRSGTSPGSAVLAANVNHRRSGRRRTSV